MSREGADRASEAIKQAPRKKVERWRVMHEQSPALLREVNGVT